MVADLHLRVSLLALSFLMGCVSTSPAERLARLYEPGADRATAAGRMDRQQIELAFTRLRDPRAGQLALDAEAAAALGFNLSTAAGYDAYRVRVRVGQGYSATVRRYCDYVFFDEAQKIVGAYRREGSCPAP